MVALSKYGERKCAREGCNKTFKPATHNQKYHDSECTKKATNKRIMDQYYRDKKRLDGELERKCQAQGCHTILSRYNPDEICASCSSGKYSNVGRFRDNY